MITLKNLHPRDKIRILFKLHGVLSRKVREIETWLYLACKEYDDAKPEAALSAALSGQESDEGRLDVFWSAKGWRLSWSDDN